MEPSPVLDVVAIGFEDGSVALHNLKYDETVASYSIAHGTGGGDGSSSSTSRITAISFTSGTGLQVRRLLPNHATLASPLLRRGFVKR